MLIDESKTDKNEWMLKAMNSKSLKFSIKYLDANENELKSEEYENKIDDTFTIPIDHNHPCYSHIKVIACTIECHDERRMRVFELSKRSQFILDKQKEPLRITQAINLKEYGN